MADEQKQHYDMTEEASKRKDAEATRAARQTESDDLSNGPGGATTPSPEGDSAGENRVTTSISKD